MSEFSGWVDMAIKFWCAVIAFFMVVFFAMVLSYRFFGWKGPAAIVLLWALVSYVHDRYQQRKPL